MSYGIRQDFYHSKAWKTARKNVWLKQNCLCALCNKPVYVDGISEFIDKQYRRTGIVHHIEELNNENVYDNNIALNEDNLVGLCIECHNKIHEDKWQDYSKGTRKEYSFDENGNIKPKELDRGAMLN